MVITRSMFCLQVSAELDPNHRRRSSLRSQPEAGGSKKAFTSFSVFSSYWSAYIMSRIRFTVTPKASKIPCNSNRGLYIYFFGMHHKSTGTGTRNG